jgi:hypothetical protein
VFGTYENIGAESIVAMVSTKGLLVPPALAAVTVKAVAGAGMVGTPVIIPVLELNERPAGRPGDTCQLSAAPPMFVGATLPTSAPRTKV